MTGNKQEEPVPATLNLAAVGRELGKHRAGGKALSAKTLSIYLNHESRPGGRYEGHPFPAPAGRVGGGPGGGSPYWLASQVPAIVEWYLTTPGPRPAAARPWTEEKKARNKAQKLHDALAEMTPAERAAYDEIAAGEAAARPVKGQRKAAPRTTKATPPPARGGRPRKAG